MPVSTPSPGHIPTLVQQDNQPFSLSSTSTEDRVPEVHGPPGPPLGRIDYRTLQLSSRSLPAPAFYYRKKTINQRIKFQSRVEWSSRRLFFVKLNKVNNEGCVADIAYKIESNNPTNSVTHCIALSVIELAELRAVRVRVRSIMSG